MMMLTLAELIGATICSAIAVFAIVGIAYETISFAAYVIKR